MSTKTDTKTVTNECIVLRFPDGFYYTGTFDHTPWQDKKVGQARGYASVGVAKREAKRIAELQDGTWVEPEPYKARQINGRWNVVKIRSLLKKAA